MTKPDEAFLKRLLATFKVEAEEHLQAISSGLIELEQAPAAEKQREIIEIIYRETHSLKGAARAVNLTNIEALCQPLESIFAALKHQEMVLLAEQFDMLHQTVDSMIKLVLSAETEQTTAEKSRIRELIQRLERVQKDETSPPKQEDGQQVAVAQPSIPTLESHPSTEKIVSIEEKPILAETVRIPTAKLDELLLQAEELIAAKLTSRQHTSELRELGSILAAWKTEWAKIQPEVRTIQRSIERDPTGNGRPSLPGPQEKANSPLAKVLDFLEWNEGYFKRVESRLTSLTRAAEQEQRMLGRMVDGLLEDMKKVVMLPVSSLLQLLPKLVRDLARDQGKEVELVIRGGEIEIDKRILEEMKDPFIHLMRNCVDHGLEKPEERTRKQKLPRGTIAITFEPKNSRQVEILVSDDGAGIDAAKVRSTALKDNRFAQAEGGNQSQQEALSLIFESGVSTSPIITDLSGRGLGLAIVREKVEKLGGAISVETQPDSGATFRIILPLALTTFRGVIVRVVERQFVLPLLNVERVASVNKAEIKTVENRETIQLGGQILSLVRLADILELPQAKAATDSADVIKIVVLTSAEKRLAFLVDEVLGEQEVLVKSLGQQLARVRNVAGATILGTGSIVPVLNVPDLMKSAVRSSTPATRELTATLTEQTETRRRSILIVEDSITARTLLKNILETAGYIVATAVDGVDAFTQLRSGEFDLVVSDVEMPRMNGFDLTIKVRGDKKLTDLPVVLVTALEARRDRERGIEVGANAYIVKSSFDQSNLLAVIQKFI